MNHETVWFPTYAQALSYTKKQAAHSNDALLGLEATTPLSWLDDKWGLWGTGEVLVSNTQRILLVSSLLKNYEELVSSTNTCILIARFFSQIVGVPAFKKAQANPPEGLSQAEIAVLNLASDYEKALTQLGLIEQGTALFALPDFAYEQGIRFGAFCNLPICYQEALRSRGIEINMPTNPISKLPEQVEPKFIFSAGKSVQSRLIFEEIMSSLQGFAEHGAGASANTGAESTSDVSNQTLTGKTLVVHPKPYELYRSLAPALAKNNISVAVVAQKKFSETSFGKGFLALADYSFGETCNKSKLVDFFFSCISGVTKQRACEIDALWRSDRLIPAEELHRTAWSESPTLEHLVELFEDADAGIILGFLEDYLKKTYGSKPAFLNEQLSALECLRGLYNAARVFNLEPKEFIPFLETMNTTSPFTTEENLPDVVITKLNHAASYTENSFQTVIACSLDAKTYRASEEHTATVTLLEKLGISSSLSRLAIMRHQFGTIQTCAQKHFICERSLNNQSEELYPAFFWDEFVSHYRNNEEDKHYQDLPEKLCGAIKSTGEEEVSQNLSVVSVDAIDASYNDAVSTQTALKDSLIHTRMVNGEELPILSPSAIESYINCPYRWFYERKLGAEGLDEGFTALEKGNVAHKTFEIFFDQLKQQIGTTSLSRVDFQDAIQFLGFIFDEVCKIQPSLDPLSGRLVPTDAIENSQIDTLKKAIETCLQNQAFLPQEFAPSFHEFTIEGYEKEGAPEPIVYAGAVLNGRVDRIDFSEDNQYFAVIDYKGSITGHEAGILEKDYDPEAFIAPHKVQALIYAAALQKVFPDKTPAAALYLSYNAKLGKNFLAGSYNPAAYAPILNVSGKGIVEINFQRYLKDIETYIEKRITEMLSGNIDPQPLCKESCSYCPITNCEKRWSDGN